MKICSNPICTKKGKQQPLDNFNKYKYAKDGLNPKCKSCVSEYMCNRYWAMTREPELHKDAYRVRDLKEIFSHYPTVNINTLKSYVYRHLKVGFSGMTDDDLHANIKGYIEYREGLKKK